MTMHAVTLRVAAATSIVAVLAATPALADPSGFVAVSGGLNNVISTYMGDTYETDGSAVNLLASGVYMFTPVLGAQGDLRLSWGTYHNDFTDFDAIALDGALHGFYREEDKFLVGGFFQFGGNRLSDDDDTLDYSRKYAGAEGQIYLDNLTLYGQGGLQQLHIDETGFALGMDGWFGSLEARYFLTPDFRVDAHIGASTYDIDFGLSYTMTTLNVGLGAEYRLENLPVSLFASYDFYATSYDVDPSPTLDEHRFMVGAKFAIGEDSLLARDRSGASLKLVESPVLEISAPAP